MLRRRRVILPSSTGGVHHLYRSVRYPQRYVRINRNPNGTHDVFLHSTMGVITCLRFIRNPRRP